MKAYWESGSIAPSILDLGTRWRWVVSFTPRPLYPREKSLRYQLDKRLCGLQSLSERGEEEKIPSPCWDSNHRSSSPIFWKSWSTITRGSSTTHARAQAWLWRRNIQAAIVHWVLRTSRNCSLVFKIFHHGIQEQKSFRFIIAELRSRYSSEGKYVTQMDRCAFIQKQQ
jgi:hypothetical protein